MTRIEFLVVHGSNTPPDEDIGAAELRLKHRAKGWINLGYHYVIRRNGEVEKGRPDDMPGAHEPRVNRVSIAVCLVGGSPPSGEQSYTPEQHAALEGLLRELKAQHPQAVILGHRDVQGVRSTCPAFDVKAWAAERHL